MYSDPLGVASPDSPISERLAPVDYPLRRLHLIALNWYRRAVADGVVRREVDRRTLPPGGAVSTALCNADLIARWADRIDLRLVNMIQPSICLANKILTDGERAISDADD